MPGRKGSQAGAEQVKNSGHLMRLGGIEEGTRGAAEGSMRRGKPISGAKRKEPG